MTDIQKSLLRNEKKIVEISHPKIQKGFGWGHEDYEDGTRAVVFNGEVYTLQASQYQISLTGIPLENIGKIKMVEKQLYNPTEKSLVDLLKSNDYSIRPDKLQGLNIVYYYSQSD